MQTGCQRAAQARHSMRPASHRHFLQGLCITGGNNENCDLRFTILFLCVALLLIVHAGCMAGDSSFGNHIGINHPDKKVSPPVMAVYEGKIFISYIREEEDVYLTVLSED